MHYFFRLEWLTMVMLWFWYLILIFNSDIWFWYLFLIFNSDFCPIFSGSNDWQRSCCDPGPWGHQLAGFQWGSQCRSHWIPPTAQYVGTNSKDSQKSVPAGRSKFTNDSNDTYRRNRKQWRSVFQSEPPSNTNYGWSMKKKGKKKSNKKIEKKKLKRKRKSMKKGFFKKLFLQLQLW